MPSALGYRSLILLSFRGQQWNSSGGYGMLRAEIFCSELGHQEYHIAMGIDNYIRNYQLQPNVLILPNSIQVKTTKS